MHLPAWSNANKPLLVLDTRNAPALPKRFRVSQPTDNQTINWQGFKELHIMGSGQFSKNSFEVVMEKNKVKQLTVIDLRQESHGFINGNAVSWFGSHNATNADKKEWQIEKSQAQLLNEIKLEEPVNVYLILKKVEANILKKKPIEFLVHQVSSEEEYLHAKQIKYERIYVQDFHAPRESQVDRFIKIVTQIPKNNWIYFHCRAGSGRTSTFMLMYDMMQNAKGLSFDELMDRQKEIGSKDLRKLPYKKQYKYKYAVARLKFIKQFYQYARDNQDAYATYFSKWAKQRPL